MRHRPFALGMTLVFALGACKDKPGAGGAIDRAADKALVDKVKASTTDLEKARRDALVAAKDTLFPRPDLGTCPTKFEPSLEATTAYGTSSPNPGIWDTPRWGPKDSGLAVLDNMHTEDSMLSIHKLGIAFWDEVDKKPGPRTFRVDSSASLSNGLLTPYSRGELEKYAVATYEQVDFQLVIDKEISAQPGEDKKFEPGVLFGRFYAYDHVKRLVVCAARIGVVNSENLKFSYTAQYDKNHNVEKDDKEQARAKALRGDLRMQALISASEKLFIAGPKLVEAFDAGVVRDASARD